MSKKKASSTFQEVIESVEALPPEDQILLIEIIRQRLIQHRRAELAEEIAEARNAYRRGDVHRGTVMELMKELVKRGVGPDVHEKKRSGQEDGALHVK